MSSIWEVVETRFEDVHRLFGGNRVRELERLDVVGSRICFPVNVQI